MHLFKRTVLLFSIFGLTACGNADVKSPSPEILEAQKSIVTKPEFERISLATFDKPWAMAVLPHSDKTKRQFLVTQKSGELFLFDLAQNKKFPVANVPEVAYGGQGGLGDVILTPDFTESQRIYISYAEEGEKNTRGAKVIRAKLNGLTTLTSDSPSLKLTDIESIWTQLPKTTGKGHYGHRLVVSPDQKYLFITSGDRRKLEPAQDMNSSLGKIIRVHLDGSIPTDNPYADKPAPTDAIWSSGQRNPLGISFDNKGRLWEMEMGPRHGDELNLIEPKNNYGWPEVSQGRHYSGINIPNHDTRPEFVPPTVAWVPAISPGSLAIYYGDSFPDWNGKALISGLSSGSLVVVDFESEKPAETYRYELETRLRNVTTDGNDVYLMEDGDNANFWQLVPAK